MPIYEYYCSDCRETFSALRSMSQADAIIACTACDSTDTNRVLSLFAFHSESQPVRTAPSRGGCGCGGGCGCAVQ